DAGLLNIDTTTGAETLKTSADSETKARYSFIVVASSKDLSSEQSVTVTVNNLLDTDFGSVSLSEATDTGEKDNTTSFGNPVVQFTGEPGLEIGIDGPDGKALPEGSYRVTESPAGVYTVTLLDAIPGGAPDPFGTLLDGQPTGNGVGTGDGVYIIQAADAAGNAQTVGSVTIDTTVAIQSSQSTVGVDQYSEFDTHVLNQGLLNLTEPLDTGTAPLSITVTALPETGTLTLNNGTPVKLGDRLDVASLTSLSYEPVVGFSGSAGQFTYRVDAVTAKADRTVDIQVRPIMYVSIVPQDATQLEGNDGASTPFTFTVQRGGDLSAATVGWSVDSSGDVDRTDFAGSKLPSGLIHFAEGENSQTLTVSVLGDSLKESIETFAVRLGDVQIDSATAANGLRVQTLIPVAQGKIEDDDSPLQIVSVTPLDTGKGSDQSVYGAGDALQFEVKFNRSVTVGGDTGLPFTLDNRTDGNSFTSVTRTARLVSGSGTDTLIFAYSIDPQDANNAGVHLLGSLQGGSVVDKAGNLADVSFSAPLWTVPVINVLNGVAEFGYIAGATVYADTNANGLQDAGEPATTTDPFGHYSLTASVGALHLSGGTDISTGLPFTEWLSAPEGATVINWLSSVLVALGDTGTPDAAYSAEQSLLKTALGLASGIDLLNYDPVAETTRGLAPLDDIYTGLATQSSQMQLANLVLGSVGTLVAASTAELQSGEAGTAVLTALAQYIKDHAALAIDLTDAGVIRSVLDAAAQSLGITQVETLGSTVDAIVARNELAVQNATADTALDAYDRLVNMVGDGVDTVAPVRLSVFAQTPDQSEGVSGTTQYIFTAIRSGNPRQPLTVDYTIGGDAGIDVDDFGGQLPHGTLSFAAGSIIAPFTVSVSGDATLEADETFTVTLENASIPVVMEHPAASSLIRNDDPSGLQVHLPGLVPSLAGHPVNISGVTVSDTLNSKATLTVTLTPEVGRVAVSASGAATVNRNGDTLVVTGSSDEINATLEHLVFTGDVGGLAGKLLVNLSDGDPTTPDPGAKMTIDLLYPTVIEIPEQVHITAGLVSSLAGIRLTDPENDRRGVPLTVTLTPEGGQITLTPDAYTRVTFLANGVVQLDGLVNDVNHTLSSLGFSATPGGTQVSLGIDTDDHFDYTPNSSATLNLIVDQPESTVVASQQAVRVDQYSEFKSPLQNQVQLNLGEPLNTGTAVLGITVTALPETGTLALNDGTPVQVGDGLDVARLTTLEYTPPAGFSGEAGHLAYDVVSGATRAQRTVDITVTPVTYLSLTELAADRLEGSDGASTPFTFTVQRGGDLSAATVSWAVEEGNGEATAEDFAKGVLPKGQLHYAAGETGKTLTIPVSADQLVENLEHFTVRITGTQVADGVDVQIPAPAAQGVIQDDDSPLTILRVTPLDTGSGAQHTQYVAGDTLEFEVQFNRSVTAGEGAGIDFSLDSRTDATNFQTMAHTAGLVSGSGTDTLRYAYTLTDQDANLKGINLSGHLSGEVSDVAGNKAAADFAPLVWNTPEINVNRGVVLDGYIAGATVYADTNDNQQRDPAEVSVLSNDLGQYELIAASGTLRLSGGTDLAANLPFVGSLAAPEGATVISPLTTLLVALNQTGLASPEAVLKTALGLTGTIDLAHYDPLVEASRSMAQRDSIAIGVNTNAVLTQVADLMILGGTVLASGAASGSTVTNTSAGQVVITALADYISARAGLNVDLTDKTVVKAVLLSAMDALTVAPGAKALDTAINAITISNDQLEQIAKGNMSDASSTYDQLTAMAQIQTLAKANDLKALAGNTFAQTTVGLSAPVRLV
ncbi:MAG: Calx-beta domain-containing protein, partial [Methylococcaceae bacterium]